VPNRRARLIGMAEDELAPDAETVDLGEGDRTLDLLEGDSLLDLAEHVRVARLHTELERLEVGGLEQAHELLVDTIDPRLRREADLTVETSRDDPLQDRLRPAHVQPEGLVLDADPRRPVALEDFLDLVEDIRGCSVPWLESRVVGAEHALERTAAVRDQRQRVDGAEHVPRREGENVVVPGGRTGRSGHDLVPVP